MSGVNSSNRSSISSSSNASPMSSTVLNTADPTAEFLAREKEALAQIEAVGVPASLPSLPSSRSDSITSLTSGGSNVIHANAPKLQHVPSMVSRSPSISSSSSVLGHSSKATTHRIETAIMQKWREDKAAALAEREIHSDAIRREIIAKAVEDLAAFEKEHAAIVEQRKTRNRQKDNDKGGEKNRREGSFGGEEEKLTEKDVWKKALEWIEMLPKPKHEPTRLKAIVVSLNKVAAETS